MLQKQSHVAIAFVLATILFSATALTAQSGFAKVRGDGSVATFGGTDTTNVTAVHNSVGGYTVSFQGNFSPTITPDNVVISTTAESGFYAVTNTYVLNATPTEIDVFVYRWRSSDLMYFDGAVFVTINVGTPPTGLSSAATSENK